VREVVESFVTTQGQPPTPDRLPPRSRRPGTDRWGAVDTVLPPAMLRPSWTKRRAQKVKAGVRTGIASIRILTGHDGCLVGLQCQGALGQPGREARLAPACWRVTLAMRAASLGRALAGDGRLFPLQPGLERVMQEAMGEDGAAPTALRPPLSPLDARAILALHRGLYPPCAIQEAPWPGRVLAERPPQPRMSNRVEAPFDVQGEDPVRAPTPLPGSAQGLYGRLARSRALRVRGKRRLEPRLEGQGDDGLGKTSGHGWHASHPLPTAPVGDRHRAPRWRKVTPRRQAMPALLEVVRPLPLEVRERFFVHAGGAWVRLDSLRGIPHPPCGNQERLCCRHWCLPSLVDQHES